MCAEVQMVALSHILAGYKLQGHQRSPWHLDQQSVSVLLCLYLVRVSSKINYNTHSV